MIKITNNYIFLDEDNYKEIKLSEKERKILENYRNLHNPKAKEISQSQFELFEGLKAIYGDPTRITVKRERIDQLMYAEKLLHDNIMQELREKLNVDVGYWNKHNKDIYQDIEFWIGDRLGVSLSCSYADWEYNKNELIEKVRKALKARHK